MRFLQAICPLAFCLPAIATPYVISGTFGTSSYSGPLNGGTFAGVFTASGLPLKANTPSSYLYLTSWDILLYTSSHTLLFELNSGVSGAYAYADARNESVNGVDFLLFANSATNNMLQLNFAPAYNGVGSVVLRSPNNFVSIVDVGGTSNKQVSLVATGTSIQPEPSTFAMFGMAGMLFAIRSAARRRL